MKLYRQIVLASLACVLPQLALAFCPRPINTPLAPQGVGVVLKDGVATGVVPDLLRTLASVTGCEFKQPIVPVARQQSLFSDGDADMLVFATQTPERDQSGQFVPLFKYRAALVSVKAFERPVLSIGELMQRPELRVVLIRGFDYGPVYRQLKSPPMADRVAYANDIPDMLRRLQGGSADVSVLLPGSEYEAFRTDERLAPLKNKLVYSELGDMPWQDAGAYVSTKSLAKQDQAMLINGLRHMDIGRQALKAFGEVFPASLVKATIKPR
jgi:polar amino acid transport system substrate-binding protein